MESIHRSIVRVDHVPRSVVTTGVMLGNTKCGAALGDGSRNASLSVEDGGLHACDVTSQLLSGTRCLRTGSPTRDP